MNDGLAIFCEVDSNYKDILLIFKEVLWQLEDYLGKLISSQTKTPHEDKEESTTAMYIVHCTVQLTA